MSATPIHPGKLCPDEKYRGCDFMGCEGLQRACPTWPNCPHPRVDDDLEATR